MIRRPPRSTRTDTLFPYTTLVRSDWSPITRRARRGASASQSLKSVRCTNRAPGRCGFTNRSEEHTSELQSLMRNSYAVFCLKKKSQKNKLNKYNHKVLDTQSETQLKTKKQNIHSTY